MRSCWIFYCLQNCCHLQSFWGLRGSIAWRLRFQSDRIWANRQRWNRTFLAEFRWLQPQTWLSYRRRQCCLTSSGDRCCITLSLGLSQGRLTSGRAHIGSRSSLKGRRTRHRITWSTSMYWTKQGRTVDLAEWVSHWGISILLLDHIQRVFEALWPILLEKVFLSIYLGN